ncbi:copper chaperone PCu(A)C [Blastococcus sp. TF02A-26]|uniref:copper chaperone PCu(A)C n=1 Tax=Blastococcus sp. TF02A-26 TaxID=2250577 RepID=UPI000DEAC2FC|nr:copper chaperone PCu(A)C [Blastococcus sp. TF02A-26]
MPTKLTGRAAVLAVAAGLTAACGGDELPDVDTSGAIGPDAEVTDELEVLQVQLAFPLDGVYEVGDDAPLYLGIANTGPQADELVDVRGPDFADARITVDGAPAPIRVPPEDNVPVGAEGAPSIVLEDLGTELRSSQSIPVTFVFEDAGTVTVEAMVSAERTDAEAPYDFPDPAEDPST